MELWGAKLTKPILVCQTADLVSDCESKMGSSIHQSAAIVVLIADSSVLLLLLHV